VPTKKPASEGKRRPAKATPPAAVAAPSKAPEPVAPAAVPPPPPVRLEAPGRVETEGRDIERGKPGKKWLPEETAKQLQIVEGFMVQGYGPTQIKTALTSAKLGCGVPRIRVLMDRVRDRWQKEDQAARATWKTAQIRRLHGHLKKVTTEVPGRDEVKDKEGKVISPAVKGTKANWQAAVAIESLLADIQGTREPIQVNVDVRVTEAMLAVIGQLPPEEMQEWVAEYEEQAALAARARELGLNPVQGQVVESRRVG